MTEKKRIQLGKRKSAILTDIRRQFGIDFPQSVVFANHHSDAHNMMLFGRAVAVDPKGKPEEPAGPSGRRFILEMPGIGKGVNIRCYRRRELV